ncbi:MAG: DNA primase [Deltaproteobacteria bacterium]|nr:DNA primase [Deltaproteobacteria bacterium]
MSGKNSDLGSKVEMIREKVEAKAEEERLKFSPKTTWEVISSKSIFEALNSNEDGDAWLFIKLFKERLCFDHAANRWFEWQGHHWGEDLIGQATASLDEVVELYGNEAHRQSWLRLKAQKENNKAAAEKHKELEENLMKRISQIQTAHRKKNILALASSGKNSLGIAGKEWDRKPWLLACVNGTVNLKTGQIRDGNPQDYIKTASPTPWTGINEPAPCWDNFLHVIFDGNEDLVNYMQRLLGYSITGLNTEHVLPILWGRGRNGKGTLLEVLRHVLGPLAGPIQSEMLVEQGRMRSSAGPSSDIMSLFGRRLAWASETDEGRKLNISKVKWLVGGDTLVGRYPYGKNEIHFIPTHTLFLLTNHKPHVPSDDYALWERIHLVPFSFSFVDNPTETNERLRDPELAQKLKAEAAGILAWLVRGCLKWQQHGLRPPKAVRQATAQYRSDEDLTGQFLDEWCIIMPNASVKAGNLYEAFSKWCKNNGFSPISGYKFSKRMQDRFDRDDSGRHRIYKGVCLRDESLLQ